MKKAKMIAVIMGIVLLLCAHMPATAEDSPEYTLLSGAVLYDVWADVDVSVSQGRDTAKAVFTEIWNVIDKDVDVVLRICAEKDGVPGASVVAEWVSAHGAILWFVPGGEAEQETWQPADIAADAGSAASDDAGGDGYPDYVLNTNTEKFHYPDCPSVDEMKPENRVDFHGTRDEAVNRGYAPCGRCKP